MRLLALLLVAVVLGGCGSAERAQPTTPVTSSPTPSSQPADAERSSPSPHLRYAVLGDSYSNGQSVGAPFAWPAVLAHLLTRAGRPTDVVANPSVTGATTAQMLETGLPAIRRSRPDVMTVMLGVNDQVQGHSTTAFEADEDRALAAAIEITGSPERVLAVDIPDYSVAPAAAQFGDPAQIAAEIDAFNAVIRRVAARRHVRLVSIVDISRRLGAAGISSDGLHPNADQLAEWAARIAPVARRSWATAG